MMVLGLVNLGFGVLSLATDLVRLPPVGAGGLLIAGGLTTAAGYLVWAGSRAVLSVSTSLFGMLLGLQLGGLATADQTGQRNMPRLIILGLLVTALAVAWTAGRRSNPTRH